MQCQLQAVKLIIESFPILYKTDVWINVDDEVLIMEWKIIGSAGYNVEVTFPTLRLSVWMNKLYRGVMCIASSFLLFVSFLFISWWVECMLLFVSTVSEGERKNCIIVKPLQRSMVCIRWSKPNTQPVTAVVQVSTSAQTGQKFPVPRMHCGCVWNQSRHTHHLRPRSSRGFYNRPGGFRGLSLHDICCWCSIWLAVIGFTFEKLNKRGSKPKRGGSKLEGITPSKGVSTPPPRSCL